MAKDRFCRKCGGPIPEEMRSNAAYCSDLCRNAYGNDQQAERNRAKKSEDTIGIDSYGFLTRKGLAESDLVLGGHPASEDAGTTLPESTREHVGL